jgi:hypothetical protein
VYAGGNVVFVNGRRRRDWRMETGKWKLEKGEWSMEYGNSDL